MGAVSFYLKRPDAIVETSIFLVFRYDGQTFKYYSGEQVQPKNWNFKAQRTKGASNINDFLNTLEKAVEDIERKARINGERLSPDELKTRMDEHFNKVVVEKHTLFSFIESFIESVKATKGKKTIISYQNALRHLKEFSKYSKKKIDFDKINLDFYNDYMDYFIKEKKFANNTTGKQIRILKTFLNEATERGINSKLDFKSKRFKSISEDVETIYLTEDEIMKMYELDLSAKSRLERVRDLFIVGCWTGLRFSDFSQIKPENIKKDYFHIRTQKTDEPVVIPIHWTVKGIMDKYKETYENSLPPAISNQKMNKYLKEIGKLAGLKEKTSVTVSNGALRVSTIEKKYNLISTHTARRSFATNLYNQGFPSISIMKITGHRTEKAFMKYIKITPEQVAKKLMEHWSQKPVLKAI